MAATPLCAQQDVISVAAPPNPFPATLTVVDNSSLHQQIAVNITFAQYIEGVLQAEMSNAVDTYMSTPPINHGARQEAFEAQVLAAQNYFLSNVMERPACYTSLNPLTVISATSCQVYTAQLDAFDVPDMTAATLGRAVRKSKLDLKASPSRDCRLIADERGES